MHVGLRERLARDDRLAGAIRRFLSARGYLEVATPALCPFLIPEPSIEVFATTFHASRTDQRLYLAPSPELWMKRLIAHGSGSIYQVARAFRNGDFGGPLHNPEFRLLEWYTTGSAYLQEVGVLEELLRELRRAATVLRPDPERVAPPVRTMTMEEAFRELAGIDLAAPAHSGMEGAGAAPMIEAGRRAGLDVRDDSTWEQAFHVAFLSLVEPRLPTDRPLVLADWPALVRTTARRKPDTPWAERWELYLDGVEVANCYSEETDPAEVRRFLAEETARKRAAARTPHPTDKAFARLFDAGFPACSGVALGVDRLALALEGGQSLEEVILFPLSAIVGGTSGTEGAP